MNWGLRSFWQDSKVNLGTSLDSYANMEEILRSNRFSTKFEFIYRQTCSFTKVEGYMEIIALMVTETSNISLPHSASLPVFRFFSMRSLATNEV